MATKPKRSFTAEQKAEAVKIVAQSGKSVSQVARELGLTASALHKWVNQAKIDREGSPTGQMTTAEREELSSGRKNLRNSQRK